MADAMKAGFLLAAAILLSPRPASATEPARPAPGREQVRIEHAGEAVYEANDHRFILTGEVRIRRGTLTLSADRLVIFLDAHEGGIESGTATGHVRIEDSGRTASADRADLAQGGDKVILSGGEPKLVEGGNEITAERITYTFSTRRLVAEGGVRGILIPGGAQESPVDAFR